MSSLVDEKYKVASLVKALGIFTLTDLEEMLHEDQVPEIVYVMIPELKKKGFIEISHNEVLVFNPETFDFDKKIVMVYKVLPDKCKELEEYIAELDKQRLQPDAQGRPRGLSYRVLEQLIEDVISHPETLKEQETEINYYVGLAQDEEMSERQPDLRQRAISEAYIRVLYGKYLGLKSLWINAILQLLTASQIFDTYNLVELQESAEQHARKIFISKCDQTQYSNINDDRIGYLLEVQEGAKKIKQIISPNENQLRDFFSLVDQKLKEIKEVTEKPLSQKESDVVSFSPLSTQLEMLAEQASMGLRRLELVPKWFPPTPYPVTAFANLSSNVKVEAKFPSATRFARVCNPISQSKGNIVAFDLASAFGFPTY